MKRSKIRNKFNKKRNHENWCNFKFKLCEPKKNKRM